MTAREKKRRGRGTRETDVSGDGRAERLKQSGGPDAGGISSSSTSRVMAGTDRRMVEQSVESLLVCELLRGYIHHAKEGWVQTFGGKGDGYREFGSKPKSRRQQGALRKRARTRQKGTGAPSRPRDQSSSKRRGSILG